MFDRDYFVWNGRGESRGYRGTYADFPENLKFAEYIKALTPENVLEVGCAYGFLVKRLNDMGIPTEGVDVSRFAYKMRATDSFRVGSILDLGFYKDKQFDLGVTVETFEHILEQDVDQALSEIARVSKRGVHWIAYKEVDDLVKTHEDITHVNIKPYEWWVDKVKEICGDSHKVIHKETEWYNRSLQMPQGGEKKGLNIGSFVNMLLNTDTTQWTNIDILDLSEYARAYGYIFQKADALNLMYPDNSLDYIATSHLPEHFTPEKVREFLKNCYRMLKPDGVMRISVPDAELLMGMYLRGELGYFDEINPECEEAETQLGKLNALLWGGHKSIHDKVSLSHQLKQAGFEPTIQAFNKSSRQDLMRQIFDYHPDLSLYIDAVKPRRSREDKLKIALISGPFLKTPPDHYGGLEVVVANLAKGLADLGHDVTLFAAKGSKPIGDYKVYETVDPVLTFSTDWGKVNWYEKETEHYNMFKDKLGDFDIINGHTWWGHEYLYKLEHPEAKVCHTHHGGIWDTAPPVEKPNLIAVSRYMAEQYSKKLGVNCSWVYNGIDLDAYPYKAEKGDRLIFVGRFVSFKQPNMAIEVAKWLHMGLDLVGGAYEEPYFSQQIKPYCDGNQIILHTEVPHWKKVELLQNAKALLFPSKMGEPFGLVYTEAAACGTPTVALRDGAIPEIIAEGVSGFVRDDLDGMIEAVKRIDEIEPENCRKVIEQNFTKELMAKRYLELYCKILDGEEW